MWSCTLPPSGVSRTAIHRSPNEFRPGPSPVRLLSVFWILPRPVPISGAVARSQKSSGNTTGDCQATSPARLGAGFLGSCAESQATCPPTGPLPTILWPNLFLGPPRRGADYSLPAWAGALPSSWLRTNRLELEVNGAAPIVATRGNDAEEPLREFEALARLRGYLTLDHLVPSIPARAGSE